MGSYSRGQLVRFASVVLLVLLLLDVFPKGCAMKCWKCIAHDCENDPENNYKASKVNCLDGQQCMKVRYRMYDNITHYDSVIRTCTDNPCLENSTDTFAKCVATPKKYMIGGCTLRSCCADRDYCNSSGRVSLTLTSIVLPLVLVILNSIR